jgi:hypothetical protein
VVVHAATATAQAVQRYTYSGAAAASYTFNFQLNGIVTDSRSSISGAAGFFDDFLEQNFAFGSASGSGTGLGTGPSAYADSFSVTMSFNPGDSFLMKSWLTASVLGTYASGDTFADAMHTMSVASVTGGDTSLLTPTLMAAAVPEAPTWAMSLAGAGVLLLRYRRRR